MDILLSTGSLTPRNLPSIASIAREGYADGLEILLTGRLLAVGPEAAVRDADEHHVPIRSVHPPIRFVGAQQWLHDDMIAAAQYARMIPGCRTLVMHAIGGASLHTEQGRAFFTTIEHVTEVLKGSGVRLTLENRGTVHPQPRLDFLDKMQNLYRVCEEWGLGITFDTSHAASYGVNIVSALDVIAPRLANIHLSDRREDPPLFASSFWNSLTREHQLPGSGALPLAAMLHRLRAKRYRGTITLELSPLALSSWSDVRARERTAQAIAFVREQLSERSASAADRAHRTEHAPTPADNDF